MENDLQYRADAIVKELKEALSTISKELHRLRSDVNERVE